MLTILADTRITRRQSMFFVTDPNGVLRWSGRTMSSCMLWLVENGETEVRVETEDNIYIVNLAVWKD